MPDRLYNLLPALYRIRDVAQGGPLQALLAVIETELDRVERDVATLYENWFIETCDEWVVPYLGDLLGVRGLTAKEADAPYSQRAFVANTLRYRRRKGTLAVLEDLAADVSGYSARAVAFFEQLGWTQHLNHPRYVMSLNPAALNPNAVDRVGTVNLRSRDVLDRLDGPFDDVSHTVDVRPLHTLDGWHNIRKVGLFLWRLKPYPMRSVRARKAVGVDHGFHISPLGHDTPLFHLPDTRDTGRTTETQVPAPLRPMAFYDDLQDHAAETDAGVSTAYYGPDRGLRLFRDTVPVPPSDLLCKDLGTWDPPPAGKVALDVRRGRLAFSPGEVPPRVYTDHTYGFSADLGGGPYDRTGDFAVLPVPDEETDPVPLVLDVAKGTARPTLQQALLEWTDAGKPPCLIRITDSRIYGGNLDVELPANGWLAIEAADGMRPNLRMVGISSIRVTAVDATATFIASGLLVEGGFELSGALDFQLIHTTLVPGWRLHADGSPFFPDRDSLTVATASPDLRVTIRKSIVGTLRLPEDTEALTIEDSLVLAHPVGGVPQPAIAADDAFAPGPVTTLRRCTLWGDVYVRELTASEVIFNQRVTARRRQQGCVRFSFVPDSSVTPSRYRCQPDLALAARAEALGLASPADLPTGERQAVLARVCPEYTSERYGDPAFAQLHLNIPDELRTGAEDGSEMGAFAALQHPQRLLQLRTRLDEYLPYGLEASFIFVT
jgi:hypothetical protein